MLSLNGGGSNRLPPRAKLSFQNSASVYWRCFKTPDSPDDHDSGFFKLSASLYISQSWGSGPSRDGDNWPSGRHDICWFPYNGFEIPLDEGPLASSLKMILLRGLVRCQASPDSGHPLASTSLLLITLFWVGVSVNFCCHCWGYGLIVSVSGTFMRGVT